MADHHNHSDSDCLNSMLHNALGKFADLFHVLRDSGRLLIRPLLVFGLLWVLSIIGGGSPTNVLIVFGIGFLLFYILIVKYENPSYSFRREALALIKKGVKKLCILFVAVVLKVYTVFDAKVLSKLPRGNILELICWICVYIGLIILQNILRNYPPVSVVCIAGISGITVGITVRITFTIIKIMDDYGIFDSFNPGQNDPRIIIGITFTFIIIIGITFTFIIIIAMFQ